jgi:hypothetical protein
MLAAMALQESDREDLLREATALVERIEFGASDNAAAEPVVAGFRSDGALSIFFGQDPVFQFNAAGKLRRAYAGGLLLKAERGKLVSLRRVRQSNQVQLVSHHLSEDEQLVFVADMHYRLREFLTRLNTGRLTPTGQVPADSDVLGRVKNWLAEHELIAIAQSPRVGA